MIDRNKGQRICKVEHQKKARYPKQTLSKIEKNRFCYMTRKYGKDDIFQNRIIKNTKIRWKNRKGVITKAEGNNLI